LKNKYPSSGTNKPKPALTKACESPTAQLRSVQAYRHADEFELQQLYNARGDQALKPKLNLQTFEPQTPNPKPQTLRYL
jgi:uncharacterized Rmd1/YagE family protein